MLCCERENLPRIDTVPLLTRKKDLIRIASKLKAELVRAEEPFSGVNSGFAGKDIP